MKASHWKKLESSEVLSHPRIHLIEDTVELPDGKKTKYIRHAPYKNHAVIIIAINNKGEILVQKEYSYPPDVIMWQLPGGSIEDTEDVLQAANRELSEESGYVADSSKEIGYFYVNNRRSDEKQYIVLSTDLREKVGQRDEEEFIETHWMPVAKLREMVALGQCNNINLLAALNIWFCRSDTTEA
jgi:ADP-ribose pyrophosphatase